jgi:glutathione S-transferase
MDELTTLNSDPEWTAKQYTAIRKELGTLELIFKERGTFLGGKEPIHADFCVFA